MRPQPAAEHRAAIEEQVLRRDRRGDARAGRAHELDACPRRHVLEHYPQPRVPLDEGNEFPLDENALAIVGVDVVAGRLAVKQQHDVSLFHARYGCLAAGEGSHARVRMRRRARRVALHAGDETAFRGAVDLRGICPVGEVKGHERLERRARRQRSADPVAIVARRGDACDRRLEVRHDDGPREGAGRPGDDGCEFRAVPQVQVPVVRPCDLQCWNRARQRGFNLDPRAPQTGSYRAGRRHGYESEAPHG